MNRKINYRQIPVCRGKAGRGFLAFFLAFLQEIHARRAKNGLYSNFGAVPCETGIFVPTNGKPLDITRFRRRRTILTENGINPTETDSFVRSSKSVCGKPHMGLNPILSAGTPLRKQFRGVFPKDGSSQIPAFGVGTTAKYSFKDSIKE